MYRIALFVLLFSNCLWAGGDPYGLYWYPEDTFKVYGSLRGTSIIRERVRAIRLQEMQLKEIPEQLKSYSNLEYLGLAVNEITLNDHDLEVIRSLRNLQGLILWGNKITEITPEFVDALPPSLKVLDLEGNRIEGLPVEFGKLSQLELLSLAGNPIKSFPEVIFKLEELVVLTIEGAELTTVDYDFRSLNKLKDILFSGNQLESVNIQLPRTIITVGLRDAKIRSLDGNFGECPNLKRLLMTGNPDFVVPEGLKELEEKGILILSEEAK